MSLDDAEIARLRALCEAVAHGPWSVVDCDVSDADDETVCTTWVESIHDTGACRDHAAFIAEARSALPAALDEIERLRALLAKTHRCPECDATCRSCTTCGYQFG